LGVIVPVLARTAGPAELVELDKGVLASGDVGGALVGIFEGFMGGGEGEGESMHVVY